jgi:hypothetical protein
VLEPIGLYYEARTYVTQKTQRSLISLSHTGHERYHDFDSVQKDNLLAGVNPQFGAWLREKIPAFEIRE